MPRTTLDQEFTRIIEAVHHDPFSVLGRHPLATGETIRAFIPGAREVAIPEADVTLTRVANTDLFEWQGEADVVPERYHLQWRDADGRPQRTLDPYCLPPQISDYDLYLFGEGKHRRAYRFLGAHVREVEGIKGVLFATWAPNAQRVSVVGDFNRWDGRRHPMRVRGGSGVWELFIPELEEGIVYKFEIRNRQSGQIFLKSDPYGQRSEVRPNTASIVPSMESFPWRDAQWLARRRQADWQHSPLAIYEVHLGSWQRTRDNEFLGYRELAIRLTDYVLAMGYTHIELLPVSEHPLDASWGYQTVGYFAATSRFGTPDDFRYFVDYLHQHGIGVILDWVPGHFPKDAHGLARFDGSALYEHEDPRLGEHKDWGTLIFNYGRNEVKDFLISNALFWLNEFHIDGLRVDAVASMLYLDYSRAPNEWVPNRFGGNENLEAIEFLRELNRVAHEEHPGVLMVAEESTAWPMVSRPVYLGGLGFTMKWNMGWMNDTLAYLGQDPVYRSYQHDKLTFSQVYAYTENFLLPFSHDEVVHGKGSLLGKMPGDQWQKFANLRLLLTYMYTHPGKKLLFMGCEFGQEREWNVDHALDWPLSEEGFSGGLQRLARDLNRAYSSEPALHQYDFDQRGFKWIDCHDAAQSVLAFMRRSDREDLIVVLNFTPVPREGYRIGVPRSGPYQEIFNSDSEYYGGSNVGNGAGLCAEVGPWMNQPFSLRLTLPPLAGIIIKSVG